MLCPDGHGVQSALSIADDNLAVLQCGCHRPQALPLTPGHISAENFDPRSDDVIRKVAHELFPLVSPHAEWQLSLAI